jgi:hypothetical protein
MLAHPKRTSRDYARAVARLVATLPVERAAQVYDFVCFLQAQSAMSQPMPAEEDDWLNDSEAEMQAEDVRWQATYDQHRAEFLRLRERALHEIASGETQPLFDENGDVAI